MVVLFRCHNKWPQTTWYLPPLQAGSLPTTPSLPHPPPPQSWRLWEYNHFQALSRGWLNSVLWLTVGLRSHFPVGSQQGLVFAPTGCLHSF